MADTPVYITSIRAVAPLVVTGGTSPVISLTSGGTTILTVPYGGTGVGTLTGLVQGNGTGVFTAVSNSSTVGQVLRVSGAATYAWGALDLADGDAVTGTLPIANGGTGSATQNFVDLTTTQASIAGVKTFTSGVSLGTSANLIIGASGRFLFSDTATSYAALLGQGASTLVNHFMQPTAQNGRHYAFASQIDPGATTAGDKVAIYGAAQSGTGTSDIWAANFLIQWPATGSYPGVNMQGIEVDVNNNNTDSALAASKIVDGININSGGLKRTWRAIRIDATDKVAPFDNQWRIGISMGNVSDIGIAIGAGITLPPNPVGSANISGLQFADGQDTILLERATNTSPTGDYLRCVNSGNSTNIVRLKTDGSLELAGGVTFTTLNSGTTDFGYSIDSGANWGKLRLRVAVGP